MIREVQTDQGVTAAVASRYGTFKFPETYIIDRNGRIQRKFIGPIDWEQQEIMEYLAAISGASIDIKGYRPKTVTTGNS